MPFENEVFVCMDCETTGLDVKQDRIIEVAAVAFDMNGNTIAEYESLVNPECIIPESSIEFHHITQDMVVDKPTIDKVIPELFKVLGRRTIMGHGIGFDINMVVNAANRHNIHCTIQHNPSLDTLRMARLYGDCAVNSLDELRKHFNIEYEGAHRAMSDVVVNIQVFKQLCKDYKNSKQIFEALSKPIMFKIMPLGKHKGRPIKEIPLNYLMWAANMDFDQDLLFTLRSEIKRRKRGDLFTQASNPFAGL